MQTTPLTLPSRAAAVATVLRAAWARHRDGLSFLLLIVAVLAGVLLSRLGATWPAAAAADPVIVIASPTAPLALLPTAAKVAAVPTLAHDVAAFAAPAGAYLGTAPAGAASRSRAAIRRAGRSCVSPASAATTGRAASGSRRPTRRRRPRRCRC